MSAQPFVLLDIRKTDILNSNVKLTADTLKGVLVNSTTLTHTFTGTSGLAHYSDIANTEISGTGYTTGGVSLTATVAPSGANATVTLSNTSLTTATVSATALVVIDTSYANAIVGFGFLDPTGGTAAVSSTAGAFTVSDGTGVLTL